MRKLLHLLLLFGVTISLSCAIRTYDGSRIKTCPVHDVKMKSVRVKSVHGLPPRFSEKDWAVEKRRFPYAAKPALKGCVIMPWSWMDRHDRIRACPECTVAREEFLEHKAGGLTSN